MVRAGRGPGRSLGTVVSGALAVAGTVALLVALLDQQPAPPSAVAATQSGPSPSADPMAREPARAPAPAGARARDLRDPLRGPLLTESAPVRLDIPRIGVRSPFVRLGVDAGGSLDVPRDPAVAGWYTGAPSPGALGPAVVVGHVTWDQRPGVFFRLAELRPGDRVTVRRADHRTAVFAVRRVRGYAKERFPTRAVYGPLDHAGLRLVTCGGPYDAGRHRFADNVVVFADLVAVRS